MLWPAATLPLWTWNGLSLMQVHQSSVLLQVNRENMKGEEFNNLNMKLDNFLLKGDVVNFNYPHDGHNVVATTQEAFEACAVGQDEHHPEMGPIAWTAPNEEGMTYVICGVALHCELGNQKVAIKVSNSC